MFQHRCGRNTWKIVVLAAAAAVMLLSLWTAGATAVVLEVTSTVPAENERNVPLDVTVQVVFSADIDPATVTSSSFFLRDMGGATVPSTVGYDSTTKAAWLKPATDLLPGASFLVTMTDSVLGKNGFPVGGVPRSWTFTTLTTPAPNVTNLIPRAGATNQTLDQVISVSFDRAMDPDSFTSSSFYLAKVGGGAIAATIRYYAQVGSGVATLTPKAPLELGATYQVTLTREVRGDTGRNLAGAPIVWTFSTITDLPPYVGSVVPASGAQDVPVDQAVAVTFTRAMDPATLTSAGFYLTASAGGPPLAATITYNATTKTATLTPLTDLAYDTSYRVTLTDVVKGASGLNLVGAPVTFSFTTAEAPAPPISFSDVPSTYPYSAAILRMAGLGAMKGFDDGTFRPQGLVTRQQFAKMIVLTLGLPVSQNDICPFVDVTKSTPDNPVDATDPLYPDHYIAVAAARGITQGLTSTTFAPYANISRYQVITMVVRAVDNLYPGLLVSPPAGYQPTWDPGASPSHGQNARRAEYNGLLVGIPLLSVDPFAAMSRGEVAQILANLVGLLQP